MIKEDKKFILEMAHSRQDWKDGISKMIAGGLGEWYKYACAKSNGLETDEKGHLVEKWKKESIRLITVDIIDSIIRDVKFGDRGKRKAANEVIASTKRNDEKFRMWAKRYVEKCFEVTVNAPEESDSIEFWQILNDELDSWLNV